MFTNVKNLRFGMILFLLAIIGPQLYAQGFISISSTAHLNAGYKFGKMTVFAGTNINYNTNKTTTFTDYGGLYNRPADSLVSRFFVPEMDDFYSIGPSSKTTTSKSSILYISPLIGVKIYLNEKTISPYCTFSAGKDVVLYEDNNETDKDRYDDPFFNMGVGFDYSLNSNIAIGAEVGCFIQSREYKHSYESSYSSSMSMSSSYKNMYANSYARLTLLYYFNQK